MLTTISKIVKKDIVKVFSITAISTLVKMLTGFLSVKIVASLIGPVGIALLGQLNNFSSIFLTLSTGGINSGVTKYVAQYHGSEKKINLFLKSALWITASMSVICGAVLIIGSSYFSTLILHDRKYASILIVFGCTLIFYSFNSLLLSVLNGFKEFKRLILVNIISSVVGLLFSCILAFLFNIYGALLSAVTFESVVFTVTLTIALKSPWFRRRRFIGKFSKTAGLKLAQYSLMALVTAATVPVSQLIIRSTIVEHTSLNDAGLWEGMNRISTMYLFVITSSLSVYYLPRLSEIKSDSELKSEIVSVYKIILPPLLIVSVGIFLFRNLIIHILFNNQFDEMDRLFAFQLAGDFFKIASWILAYQMLAKSMTKTYVITEILGCSTYVVLAILLVKVYGNIGATMAYALCYFIYLLTMVVVFRKLLFDYHHKEN